MKLYFSAKLITFTVVISLLILVVVFFIGLELGRISNELETKEMTSVQGGKVSESVKASMSNVLGSETVTDGPAGDRE